MVSTHSGLREFACATGPDAGGTVDRMLPGPGDTRSLGPAAVFKCSINREGAYREPVRLCPETGDLLLERSLEDPNGIYYGRTAAGDWLLASSLLLVRRGLGRPAELNEAFLRERLAGIYARSRRETAVKDIGCVGPGSAVRLRSRSDARWESIPAQPAFLLPSSEAGRATLLRETLRRAVERSIAGIAPEKVGLLVSGGLDSSAVGGLLQEILRNSNAGKAKAYHCGFTAGSIEDERPYVEVLQRSWDCLEFQWVAADDCWGLAEFGTEQGYCLDEPEIELNRSLLVKPLLYAAGEGCQVALSGYWGDQVLGADPYHTPVLLDDLGPLDLLRELPHFRAATGLHTGRLLGGTVWRRFGGRPPGRRESPAVEWLLESDLRFPVGDEYGDRPSVGGVGSARIRRELASGLTTARHAMLRHVAQRCGVELRFPFLDPEVVGLLTSLPATDRFRGGFGKHLLRRAMAGLVPQEVLLRRTVTHFTGLLDRGLREMERGKAEELLHQPLSARLGWVDAARLRRGWERYLAGEDRLRKPLADFLCVEAWLRARDAAC